MDEENAFYLDFRKRIITDISVINTKLVNQSNIFNSEYALYIFKIISPFNSWYIKKRYSEIREVYNYLVGDNPKLRFPAFPPKRLLSTKEQTIIERKNAFEQIFFFILQNIEILKYNKLINFFKISKILLIIYIKNCCLINENRLSYELIDENNSSSDSNAHESDIENKEREIGQTIKIKKNKRVNYIQRDENIFNKNENEIKLEINIEITQKNPINNNDIYNNITEDIINNNNDKAFNIRKIIKTNLNYFKCYEEFKLASGNYTCRSQVSFFIIKELLRNLKVHSSHIYEIINDFSDYIKLKKKWKKFNEKEINSLFIGINKEELFEEYFQYILKDEKTSNKQSITTLSEKSTLSSTSKSLSNLNSIININNVNINYSINKDILKEDDNNKKESQYLEGLFYYIGNFEENYFGARSCLLLLNKMFERGFNPEVDIYIKLFKKIDLKIIKKMNLCKLSSINNCINQKLCFNLINLYINSYNEEKQIKTLTELNADSMVINKFLDYNFIDESIYNPYNLE